MYASNIPTAVKQTRPENNKPYLPKKLLRKHLKFTFTFTFSERKRTDNNQINPCILRARIYLIIISPLTFRKCESE